MKIKSQVTPGEVSFSPKRTKLFLTRRLESINYHSSSHKSFFEKVTRRKARKDLGCILYTNRLANAVYNFTAEFLKGCTNGEM
jgi:hypothetical protein